MSKPLKFKVPANQKLLIEGCKSSHNKVQNLAIVIIPQKGAKSVPFPVSYIIRKGV